MSLASTFVILLILVLCGIRETITVTSVDFTGAKAFEISGEGRSFNCAQFGSRIPEPGDPNILSLLTLIVANLGTPVDCVSLALSGRLFPWSSPALVPCLFILSELDFQMLLS